MRKIIILASILMLVIGTAAFAADYGSKPHSVTSDGAAVTLPCKLTQVLVYSDGADSFKVELYDNASTASGTRLAPPITVKSGEYFSGAVLPNVIVENGIYVDITTTTGSGVVTVYTIPR